MKASKTKKQKVSSGFCSNSFVLIIICIICLTFWYYYNTTTNSNSVTKEYNNSDIDSSSNWKSISDINSNINVINTISDAYNINTNDNELSRLSSLCIDSIWCNVPMPKISHYYFDSPSCPLKWKKAQIQAANGEQVLLEKVAKVFPSTMDFIDGDRVFRRLHFMIDAFLDDRKGWGQLLPMDHPMQKMLGGIPRQAESVSDKSGNNEPHIWEKEKRRVVPDVYDFRAGNRAPIIQLGYSAFQKSTNAYFTGNFEGGVFIDRYEFFKQWRKIKDDPALPPFIAVCALNENWGIFSTNFPNRTAGWGACCNKEKDKIIYEFLDHPKTLMFVINQHHNMTHPKLISIPRGLPLTWDHTEKLIYDTIQHNLKNVKRDRLLFSATSKWGKRGQIIKCISEKFSISDFEGHIDTIDSNEMKATKTDRRRYYQKLGSSKFGVALPGLGYDCFRTWELLSMGTVIIMERGVGLDRTLWRLPALLVDDFDDINPELLHSAYVEALYRADDFDYRRLTQTFWYSIFANVSTAQSTNPLLDLFPMTPVDTGFTRPRDLFKCDTPSSCGKGTKRIPPKMC